METLTVKEYDVREAKAAIGRLATVSCFASDHRGGCHSVVGLTASDSLLWAVLQNPHFKLQPASLQGAAICIGLHSWKGFLQPLVIQATPAVLLYNCAVHTATDAVV